MFCISVGFGGNCFIDKYRVISFVQVCFFYINQDCFSVIGIVEVIIVGCFNGSKVEDNYFVIVFGI